MARQDYGVKESKSGLNFTLRLRTRHDQETKHTSLKPLVPLSPWYGDVMLAFSVVLLIRGEGNSSANNAIGGDMTDS